MAENRKIVIKDISQNERSFQLGANLNDIADSSIISPMIAYNTLHSHSQCYKYKDLDYSETAAGGYPVVESELDTSDLHKLKITSNIYTGNKNTTSNYWKYTAYRNGIYVVSCDAAIVCTNPVISDIENYFTELLYLKLFRNEAEFRLTTASIAPNKVYNAANNDYYTHYQYALHGTWAVLLNANDYIDLRVNLFNKLSPNPISLLISARATVLHYGLNNENITINAE